MRDVTKMVYLPHLSLLNIIYTPFKRSALCCETLGGLFYSIFFSNSCESVKN